MKVRELEDSFGEGARSVAKDRQENPVPLGNRPLIVIGAGKRPQPPGTSAEQWLAMRNERDAHVKELSKLSGNSKFILDPASGHTVEHDNPEACRQIHSGSGERNLTQPKARTVGFQRLAKADTASCD